MTLRDGGVLDNVANNFRVEAWMDEGGLVLGAPPVVTGLPQRAGKVAFTGLALTGDPSGVRPQSAGTGVAAVLEWVAPPGSRCALEGSADFRVWTPINAAVVETQPGQFRAVLNGTTTPARFFRLRLD